MIHSLLVILFLVLGVCFMGLAALGAWRFPDALTRMAAVSKASTLGLTLLLAAAALQAWTLEAAFKGILTIVILWLTSPIAAHLLARAALKTNEPVAPETQNQNLIAEV